MQYIVAGNAPLPPDPILPRPLNDLRLDKLAAVRAEAYHRISAKWPLWKQLNAALGVETLAKIAELRGDITAVKTASNTAEAAIIAATTNAELEAVNALWPTI